MYKWIIHFYIGLISVVAGIQIAGQILGFLGFYTTWSAILLSILLVIVFYFWILRTSYDFLDDILSPAGEKRPNQILNTLGFIAGAGLLIGLLLLPLILWPYSGINNELTWDAGLYHLPKAAELVVSHTTWDLTIDYGEYPWGYESLIAFSLVFSNSGMLIGTAHAVIVLLFAFSFFFLAARFTMLPRGVLFFAIAVIICSFDIVRDFDSNPWWIFRILAFTIGKNDFHLTTVILSMLVFSPFNLRGKGIQYSLSGMAIASALVLSTKPNGALVVLFVWLIALYAEISLVIRQQGKVKEFLKLWIPAGLVIITGVLWAIRNLIMTGRLVSENALGIQQWSILNNLTNRFFYNYLDIYFKYFLVVVLLTIVFTIFSKRFHWTTLATLLVCSISFIATPASGFFGSNQTPTQIAWRFGAYLVAFEVAIVLLMVDPLIKWFFAKSIKPLEFLIAAVMIGISGWNMYLNYPRVIPHEENAIVLRDLYRTPVGVDGYFSAYDFVQKNIRDSVVWVENGYPFYVFGPDLTNTVTRSRPADYIVYFQTPLIDEGGYPEALASAEWNSEWHLIYEDSEGRVYQRK